MRRFVHLPNKDWTSRDAAAKLASTGSIVAGLNAFGAPIIDRDSPAPAVVQFPRDDSPRFRDGKAWPEAIAGANRDANGKAMGTEAGYTIVNARTIWDASNFWPGVRCSSGVCTASWTSSGNFFSLSSNAALR